MQRCGTSGTRSQFPLYWALLSQVSLAAISFPSKVLLHIIFVLPISPFLESIFKDPVPGREFYFLMFLGRWDTQIPSLFYTCSLSFPQIFPILVLPCLCPHSQLLPTPALIQSPRLLCGLPHLPPFVHCSLSQSWLFLAPLTTRIFPSFPRVQNKISPMLSLWR